MCKLTKNIHSPHHMHFSLLFPFHIKDTDSVKSPFNLEVPRDKKKKHSSTLTLHCSLIKYSTYVVIAFSLIRCHVTG